ncbi:CIA30 family protein [Polaribacter sp.]|uniref:CIA30 family protein n=1 Tax=Polaribacter sp. TaxID=1920175 RepID=UPI003F6A799B
MSKLILIISILSIMQQTSHTIVNFSKDSDTTYWRVVDDVVMGGVSQGNFEINKEGNGFYFGNVSLENNGGFSSLRYKFKPISVTKFSKVVLKIKGDGKNYQFRIKDKQRNYYSYVKKFSTSGDWEIITIDLAEMYPVFRGRTLNMDNFSSETIEEIAILIGNKKAQNFQLEIDHIYLK